jgi:hypothetical protein
MLGIGLSLVRVKRSGETVVSIPAFADYVVDGTGTWLASGGGNYEFVDTAGSQVRPGVKWATTPLVNGQSYNFTINVAAITGASQIRVDGFSTPDQLIGAGETSFTATASAGVVRFRLEDTNTTINDGFELISFVVTQ